MRSATAPLAPDCLGATVSGGPAPPLPPDLSLGSFLERAAELGRDVGFTFHERSGDAFISYGELLRRARAVATGLAERGFSPGARIGLCAPTSIEFVVGLFGVWFAGGTVVVLPPPLPFGRVAAARAQLERIVERAGLDGAIAAPQLCEFLAAGSGVPRVSCSTDLEGSTHLYRRLDLDPDGAALIQFTSGSTTTPRGAVLSHRAVTNAIAALAAASALRADDVYSSWVPLYHDLGLGGMLLGVFAGMRIVLLRPEQFLGDPVGWLEILSHHHATITTGPNFSYALMVARLAKQPLGPLDLSSWRIAYDGGEPVDPATLDAFAAALASTGFRRVTLWPAYGMAEATLAVSLPRDGQPPRELTVDAAALADRGVVLLITPGAPGGKRLVSVGTPLPGICVAVADRGDTSAPGGVGEIYVAGPSLMRGYHADPVETARTLHDGWLVTGDLGFIHGGELFVTGRSKDLIILRGRNLYPQDIEAVANDVGGVRPGTAVAVGRTGRCGEELVVFAETKLTARADLSTTATAIEEEVAADLGVRPADVVLLPPLALPKTSSGKLQRRRTLALDETGELEVLYRRTVRADLPTKAACAMEPTSSP